MCCPGVCCVCSRGVFLILGVVEDKGPTELGATDACYPRSVGGFGFIAWGKDGALPPVLLRLNSVLLAAVCSPPPAGSSRLVAGSYPPAGAVSPGS